MFEKLNVLTEFLTIYGLKLVVALVTILVGTRIAKWLSAVTRNVMRKKNVDPALENVTVSLVYYGLLGFVIIAALGQVGIQTASFVALIGAAGLAIGLALQGSLSNLAAGFLILVFRPFRVGDFVELAGVSGAVEKILIFTTELKTADNKKVIIPNALVIGGTITNFSANDTRRIDLTVGISYADDIDRAKDVLMAVVGADERVLAEPETVIGVHALADSSVNIVVRPWVKTVDYWPTHFALTEAIKKNFDRAGITIPFPQREVHVVRRDAELASDNKA